MRRDSDPVDIRAIPKAPHCSFVTPTQKTKVKQNRSPPGLVARWQQPKLKACVWDSAKDHHTMSSFWLWTFGGIVANYPVGPQLERFLDLFLKLDPQAATTGPSFLDDPRLSLEDEPTSERRGGLNFTRHKAPLLQVFHKANVMVLRVTHWGARRALLLLSTTTTSTPLGVGWRLSQKARKKDFHHQTLLCLKGSPLGWPRRQLRFKSFRPVNWAERVGASHGSHTVISTLWSFLKCRTTAAFTGLRPDSSIAGCFRLSSPW